jgi:hypothetical protein
MIKHNKKVPDEKPTTTTRMTTTQTPQQQQQVGKKQDSAKNAWAIAKPILEKDYLEGRATDNMLPREVMALRPEIYGKVKVNNFGANWRAMKERIGKDRKRSEEDEVMYFHDMTIHTLAADLPGYWDGSEAQRLLVKDMERGRHTRYKPEMLWLKRPEYQEFELDKFRKHIYQNTRAAKETPYWTYKKALKERKKRKRLGLPVDDEDVQVYDDPVLRL